jgi:hypothetical protein
MLNSQHNKSNTNFTDALQVGGQPVLSITSAGIAAIQTCRSTILSATLLRKIQIRRLRVATPRQPPLPVHQIPRMVPFCGQVIPQSAVFIT